MGIDPPVIYSRPPSYRFETESADRGFNPRAATDAAWSQAQRNKEKRASQLSRQGPLIDKNEITKHPDSYMVIPSAYLDFKPFSKATTKAIIWMRWIQLGLRVISSIGSVGLLVCLIFLKTTGEGSDWILRIPPGIAILHSLYAVWHLAKKASYRGPGSSASYFIFACIFDAGLIPFMIYTVLEVRNEWLLVEDNIDGHWTTLFGDNYGWPQYTTQATWLAAASLGCIWVVTFCMCIYLAVQFKKIANLPPDMNPFEENLTSRAAKHKKTKSTITMVTEAESNRDSATALLNEKGPQVPWMHTRNGSTTSLGTASPPRSPRHSRYESTDSLTPPRSPYRPSQLGQDSPRNSTTSLASTHRRHGHVRQDSTGDILLPPSPNRHSNPASPYNNSPTRSSALRPAHTRAESPGAPSIYHSARASRSTLHLDAAPSTLDTTQPGSSDMNWPLSPPLSEGTWLNSSKSPARSSPIDQALVPRPLEATPPEFRHLRGENKAVDRPYVLRTASKYDYSSRSPKPLGMNPPTPPVNDQMAARAAETARENARDAAGENVGYKSNRANRASKARQVLRPTGHAANRGYAPLELRDSEEKEDWGESIRGEFLGEEEERRDEKKHVLQSKWTPTGKRNGARVVSSGYEEQGLGMGMGMGMRQGKVRERVVSGKMVEEGQGGMQALRAEMGWA